MTIRSRVVKDSVVKWRPGDENRLITMEVEFHRFILPEVNTHRSFSRNYQSSRAVPIEKMIEQVENNPAIPIHWGKNRPGMVAEEEIRDTKYALDVWVASALSAASEAREMNDAGVHKQVVNRLLEPYMWTKGVITATKAAWEDFFYLRIHRDAQPEIQELAKSIKENINKSTPETLSTGEWHLPYTQGRTSNTDSDLMQKIMVSASCCAQVSYRKLDDSLEKAEKVFKMLNLEGKEGPPHASPVEHIAVVSAYRYENMCGNFHNSYFAQYRKILGY